MELPGTVALDDGRYLDHGPDGPRVLAIETEGGLPPARRKRRRPRRSGPDRTPPAVPLTVATVIFAGSPMNPPAASGWLREATSDPAVGELIREALAVLGRGTAAAEAVTGRVIGEPVAPRDLAGMRVGYGEGEQVYDGRFAEAFEIDPAGGGGDSRRSSTERIVPLARIAAILAGREPLHACEVLVPRVRVDFDADRLMPAALMVGEAVRATIAELEFALDSPDHEADLDRLEELLPDLLRLPVKLLGEGVPAAGSTDRPEIAAEVRSALELAERVIRRYRISTQ